MTAIKIKKELETYLPLLTVKQQELLLDMVKNILHVESTEKRITVKQYNKEIEAAMKQIKEGKTVTHAEVLKKSKTWFKRK